MKGHVCEPESCTEASQRVNLSDGQKPKEEGRATL